MGHRRNFSIVLVRGRDNGGKVVEGISAVSTDTVDIATFSTTGSTVLGLIIFLFWVGEMVAASWLGCGVGILT